MAVGYLPEIGSEHGPCANDCEHTDCAETKRLLLMVCRWCDLAIGYRGFFNDSLEGHPAWSRIVHASCHEDSLAHARLASAETTTQDGWTMADIFAHAYAYPGVPVLNVATGERWEHEPHDKTNRPCVCGGNVKTLREHFADWNYPPENWESSSSQPIEATTL